MNNSWNKIIYKAAAPIYDGIFNAGPFFRVRDTLFKGIHFRPGDKVLFVGAGTGADIERLPYEQLDITAIDYSEDMLQKAKDKFQGSKITFLTMDAQQLDFADDTFDYVVGSLILSVVPDHKRSFAEMVRVCRKDGLVLIFDKFAEPGKGLSFAKKAFRHVIMLLGTDIGVSFEEACQTEKARVRLISDEGVMFGNMYRRILLKKVC
ncbi:class I SAM-dependent methyltransferase [Bacillus sp. ISL-35]|uniref:class I SAM-dependent methyltransferase n=1 Tax=Bacillus sp. ISL-35 TaxID=2819122 RepID=UPI001BEA2056|nr:class I SAM-dependent methyltransferase [Bacillus sp. ISL-35]MBT2677610.1 class I SAM-dependent methyltransferase [Bacillus sp. ISL-35]MBT2702002.1 class I SAM-dependent methyltransferase [Chryseobacterium sp. ISL-80]